MKTLVELYDERPIENVLATEVFRPKRTVYLCPKEIAQDKNLQEKLRDYFHHRGVQTELIFLESSLYYADKLYQQLNRTVEQYEDCALDITGGTDAALFACGMLCKERNIPAFTYSRKKNCFFDIHNAAFAQELNCPIKHQVEDCFLMAGGAVRKGRVDNAILADYLEQMEPYFRIYLKYKRQWTKAVQYIQRVSQGEKAPKGADSKKNKTQEPSLYVSAGYSVKGDRGARIEVPEGYLQDLQKIGFIQDLCEEEKTVSFCFADSQTRTWLRDIGSVLELFIYKKCLDAGIFEDVKTSVVVDWEGDFKRDNVTNEIDVMATYGITPLFISCKTCEISTEALNELAILRDRFGGQGAKAAIVTTKNCQTVTRHRGSELDIEVIDINDIKAGKLEEQLKSWFMAQK